MARNRAEDFKKGSLFEKFGHENSLLQKNNTEYCIFLSHKHEDKEAAEEIAEYIMKNADIDIYLDKYDDDLQRAVRNGDEKAIVKHIERGISKSTHVLCLISEQTKNSWWVPYEIGYAKKSSLKIASLKLKTVKDIPSFLKIEKIINGTSSLGKYLKEIQPNKNIILSNDWWTPINKYLDSLE